MTDRIVSTVKRTLASFLCSSASFSGSISGTPGLSTTSSTSAKDDGDEELFSPPRKRIRLEHYGDNNASDEGDEEYSNAAERKRALGVGTPPLLVSPAPVDSDALAKLFHKKKRFNRFNEEEEFEKFKEGSKEEKDEAKTSEEEPLLLCCLPSEVIVDGILSYLCTTSDRFALQTSCKLFHNLSNSPSLLRELHLFGNNNEDDNNNSDAEEDNDGGNSTTSSSDSGLIADSDTPDIACAKLAKYARAGNIQAIYMLGMIRSYCHGQVEQGASLLKLNSSLGCPRSLYALALILRDSRRNESRSYLSLAAQEGYLPAWQELLPAPEMKAKYGDLDAKVLRSYLDPPCLNRLLGRHYLYCRAVRGVQTSHCWNPLCGRWAYKATAREPTPSSTATASAAPPSSTSNTLAIDPVQSYDSFSESLQQVEALLYNSPAATSNGNVLSGILSDTSSSTNSQPTSHTHSENSQTMTTTSQSSITTTQTTTTKNNTPPSKLRVSRMKMCSQCRRAKYCSKLCQVYDWRSGKHKMECQYLRHH